MRNTTQGLRLLWTSFGGRMSFVSMGLMFANFMAVYIANDQDRTWFAQSVPAEAIFWWPSPDSLSLSLMFAPILAVIVFAMSKRSQLAANCAVAVMAVTFGMMVAGDYGALSSGVALQRHQFTLASWGQRRIVTFQEIDRAIVGCNSSWSRRSGRRRYPVYNLVLVDGRIIEVGEAQGWRSNWLVQLSDLDQELASLGVPSSPRHNMFGVQSDLSDCVSVWASNRNLNGQAAVRAIFGRAQAAV